MITHPSWSPKPFYVLSRAAFWIWLNIVILAVDMTAVLKKIQYIEDIQIFRINMPFITSCEAKNEYFMSGEALNEMKILASRDGKNGTFSTKFKFSS